MKSKKEENQGSGYKKKITLEWFQDLWNLILHWPVEITDWVPVGIAPARLSPWIWPPASRLAGEQMGSGHSE